MKKVPQVKMSRLTYLKESKNDLMRMRTKIFQDYGDIASYKIKGINNYYLRHPEHAKRILKDNQDNYLLKHPLLLNTFCPFTGKGLNFNNNLDEWQRDRSIAMMSFEPSLFFNDYSKIIVNKTTKMIERWKTDFKNGSIINMNKEIGELIISVVATSFYIKTEINPQQIMRMILDVMEISKKKLYTLPFLWYFSPFKRKYHQIVATSRLIPESLYIQREFDMAYDDMMGNFWQEYQQLPSNEAKITLCDQILTLFAVSYFTTSALIEWLLVELSIHPEIENNISTEINKIIGDRNPQFQDMKNLTYLSATIKETLRLHPTMFGIMRLSKNADVLNGYEIEKNAGIILSLYDMHRHPDFWVNPDGFDPNRFITSTFGQDNPFAYLPFGLGKRGCIGTSFSTMEAIIISTMIIQQCNLYLLPHTKINNRLTTVVSMCPDVDYMQLRFK